LKISYGLFFNFFLKKKEEKISLPKAPRRLVGPREGAARAENTGGGACSPLLSARSSAPAATALHENRT
jgi:hypothetical protein